MKLIIEDVNLYETFGKHRVDELLSSPDVAHLGDVSSRVADKTTRIAQMIPGVVASLMSAALPPGFTVSEVEIELELAGSPLGVGVNGKAKIKLCKSEQ